MAQLARLLHLLYLLHICYICLSISWPRDSCLPLALAVCCEALMNRTCTGCWVCRTQPEGCG